MKALGQQSGQSCKSSYRVAQVDLLAGQPIELGWLAGFPSALAGCEISEGDQTLKMSVGDRTVHANGFGDIVDRPFGLVHMEVEQDSSTGPILKRADRAVDIAYLVLSHTPSLSVRVSAGPWARAGQGRPATPRATAPSCFFRRAEAGNESGQRDRQAS